MDKPKILALGDDLGLWFELFSALEEGYQSERLLITEIDDHLSAVELVFLSSAYWFKTAQIKAKFGCPVVVLDNKYSTQMVVRVLDEGASDCLWIGMPLTEALARVNVQMRVWAKPVSLETVYSGSLVIHFATRQVFKDGIEVQLTPTEWNLLCILAKYKGASIRSTTLTREVWGMGAVGETRYLRLYIRYLRQKLEDEPTQPKYFLNTWGVGYALADLPQKI